MPEFYDWHDVEPPELPEGEPHDCREFAVEESTHPTRSGRITVTERCEVSWCGRIISQYADSVL